MPTYDYKCDSCGHVFEAFHSMKDEPLKKCPECGKETLRRLIGAGAGLIFKGSGFYLTDYKNTSTNTSSSKDKNESSDKKPVEKAAKSEPKSTPAKPEKSE